MANAAQNDLRDKMRFEAQFNRELDEYFEKVVRAFILRSRNRLPFNLDELFHDELRNILLTHYQRVTGPFSNRIRPVLPKDVLSTVEEDRTITRTLDQFSRIRAELQAKNINDTTKRNLEQSLQQAREFDTDTDKLEDGQVVRKAFLVGFELILTAGAILRRKLRGRRPTIVTTETQVPAEVAKLTEAEILSGIIPSIFGGEPTQIEVTKIWVAIGDSATRDTHLNADGQERKANKPFSVGGFLLKVPGDSSLGAPLKETANCRCAAVFNDKEIVAIRRRPGQRPFAEVGQ